MADRRHKELTAFTDPFRVKPGSKVTLEKDFDPAFAAGIKAQKGVEL